MSRVNYVLKAVLAGLSSGIAILVGATEATDIAASDLTLNTWLTALGAVIASFTLVYFVPNSGSSAKS